MSRPLERAGGAIASRPVVALAVLVAVSVGLGSFALRLERDTDFTSFAPEGPVAAAMRDVQSDFGTGGPAVQVMIDAGPDGNVLSPQGLRTTAQVVQAVEGVVGGRAAAEEQPVQSYLMAVRAALARVDADLRAAPDTVAAVITAMLGSPVGGEVAGLLSEDLDVEQARARTGLAVVPLAGDLGDDEAVRAALDIRQEVRSLDLGDASVRVIGQPLLEHASTELTSEELPRLLGLSLLLITIVLALVFRRAADVAIGLLGLGLALVWTYGIGALLGPGWLGWTGPFNQITTVVPVLVAGLGIDFALHLTTRRREERPSATPPPRRAGRSPPSAAPSPSRRSPPPSASSPTWRRRCHRSGTSASSPRPASSPRSS